MCVQLSLASPAPSLFLLRSALLRLNNSNVHSHVTCTSIRPLWQPLTNSNYYTGSAYYIRKRQALLAPPRSYLALPLCLPPSLALSLFLCLSASLALCRLSWILLLILFPSLPHLSFLPLPFPKAKRFVISRAPRENKRRKKNEEEETHGFASRNCDKRVNARRLRCVRQFLQSSIDRSNIFAVAILLRAEILFKAPGRGERATVIFVLPIFLKPMLYFIAK